MSSPADARIRCSSRRCAMRRSPRRSPIPRSASSCSTSSSAMAAIPIPAGHLAAVPRGPRPRPAHRRIGHRHRCRSAAARRAGAHAHRGRRDRRGLQRRRGASGGRGARAAMMSKTHQNGDGCARPPPAPKGVHALFDGRCRRAKRGGRGQHLEASRKNPLPALAPTPQRGRCCGASRSSAPACWRSNSADASHARTSRPCSSAVSICATVMRSSASANPASATARSP